jgi:hypothetical protein
MQSRATVREIEQVIEGAYWRLGIAMDRVAWQTANLMNASGSKPRAASEMVTAPAETPENVWTPEKLLGRPMYSLDGRKPEDKPKKKLYEDVDDGRPDWDEETRAEKAERARLMVMMARAQKGEGS